MAILNCPSVIKLVLSTISALFIEDYLSSTSPPLSPSPSKERGKGWEEGLRPSWTPLIIAPEERLRLSLTLF